MFVSARTIVTTTYRYTEGEHHYFILSSRGNAHLEEAQKPNIGSDVIGTLVVNLFRITPKKDSCDEVCGTDLVQVYSMNPNGTLPSMLVDQLIKKQ